MSSFHDASAAGPTAVDAVDAIRLVGAGDAWLLDVREGYEWADGHVAEAHHIPMAELGARQSEIPEDQLVLVICHSGGRSRLVTDALVRAEYNAKNVEGGMEAWLASGGLTIRDNSDN
ncbi:rhodanese-like domain-containing protein [Leifsonia sp. A12D58]|uniref:rhodanese-like domain-containing protein n=1 Tax=Leifsonia sp. A12D58 TaxID=3397674 RepID=UPI0039DFCDDA